MLSLSLSVHISLLYIEDNDIRCPKGFEVIPEEERETLWSFCLCLCESESANVEYVLWWNGVCGAHQGRPWPPEDHSPRGPWLFRRGTVPLTQTQMLSSTLLLLFCVYVDYLEQYSQFMSAQLLVLNFNLYFSEHYMIFFWAPIFVVCWLWHHLQILLSCWFCWNSDVFCEACSYFIVSWVFYNLLSYSITNKSVFPELVILLLFFPRSTIDWRACWDMLRAVPSGDGLYLWRLMCDKYMSTTSL